MKKIFFLLLPFTMCLVPCSFSQKIGIGTNTPAYKLDVQNGSINTDSVYRIGGSTVLSVKGTENLFVGTGSGSANTTGSYNTATGFRAFYSNTTGNYNTATGRQALYSNTTGNNNTAFGSQALNLGQGNASTSVGAFSLSKIGAGNNYNVAIGDSAARNLTSGSNNVVVGSWAFKDHSTGSLNTAIGNFAMGERENGSYNTALGAGSLWFTNSNLNTGIGYLAGYLNITGVNNCYLGAYADAGANNLNNIIAVGQGTVVAASNTARFGNTSTTSYGGWADWTNVSDGRFKKNVQENIPGIEFINKLRPVSYTLAATEMDAFLHQNDEKEARLSVEANNIYRQALLDKEQIRYTGFIAQEVEEASKSLGFDFSGVDAAKNENDLYGLRYAEFVVPLVKAVQEQQLLIESLQKRIAMLEETEAMLRPALLNPCATAQQPAKEIGKRQ